MLFVLQSYQQHAVTQTAWIKAANISEVLDAERDHVLQTAVMVEGGGSLFSRSALSEPKQSDLQDLVMLEKLVQKSSTVLPMFPIPRYFKTFC